MMPLGSHAATSAIAHAHALGSIVATLAGAAVHVLAIHVAHHAAVGSRVHAATHLKDKR